MNSSYILKIQTDKQNFNLLKDYKIQIISFM